MRLSVIRIGFDFFVILVFAYIAWESLSFTTIAGYYPGTIAGLALLLAIANLGMSLRSFLKHGLSIGSSESATASLRESDEPEVYSATAKRAGLVLTWMLGFVGLTWIVGLPLATMVFLLSFFHFEAKRPIVFTLLGTFGAVALQALTFDILGLRWPPSVFPGLGILPWG